MCARADRRIGRREFLKETAAGTVALGGAVLVGELGLDAARPPAREDPPATHNMLVFGTEAAFLSHLPMFDGLDRTGADFTSPHRYQVILDAAFTKSGQNLVDVYLKDRRAHPGTRIYTLGPEEEFVLSRLFTHENAPELASFRATVFRGHLEHGGRPVPGLESVSVEVARVVHGRKFDPAGRKPEALEYLLVGKGRERFLVHAIFGPPDFDQVLSVTVRNDDPTAPDVGNGVRVIVPGRKNVVTERLREKQQVEATLGANPSTSANRKVQLEVGPQIYFEEGELRVPPTFKPTTEEKRG